MTAIELLERYGTDAVSFQALESGILFWRDSQPAAGTGAAIGYADTGRAWIAVGSPLIAPEQRATAAARFAADARAAGRRAVFVCVEDLSPFHAFRHLPIGLQSTLVPSDWPATLAARPRLREQLRRARGKGVTVRRLSSAELAIGTPLRDEIEGLREAWLASRRMDPMGFIVTVEPFHRPEDHIYLIAERAGRIVQFLSAVPIYASGGWLVEDRLRSSDAPNGTTELLVGRLMVEASTATRITPGLTPLAGPLPWWLRLARLTTAPFYDFAGLERFRARLAPACWDPVYLVWDRGPAILALADLLTAFACGRLLRFAVRSVVHHPGGPPWALALPLIPWTVLLALLAVIGQAAVLGFTSSALVAWVIYDAVLVWLLIRAAFMPDPARIGLAAGWAAIDAALSLEHLRRAGLGAGPIGDALRLVATLAPVVGSAALTWAWRLARRRAEPRHR